MALNVKFLNKYYELPDDIITYLDALDLADSIKETLFASFRNKVNASSVKAIDSESMHVELRKQAEVFIKLLCDKGIYNKTIDEYTFDNEGYKVFSETNKSALLAMSNFLVEEMENFQRGIETAEREAASNITGTGFQVWTSSFLTLAATSAYEYSVLKKQANKADAQYRNQVNYISKKGSDRREQQEIDYLNNTYFPNMSKALTLFAYCLMDKYLADLSENGQFNNDALAYVNVKRSLELLDNLRISENKDAVLTSAFIQCPFNINIYLDASYYGLFSGEELETLKVLKQDKEFIRRSYEEFLDYSEIEHSASIKKDLELKQRLIATLCLCTSQKPTYYYQKFAQKEIENIRKKYGEIRTASINDDECQKLIDGLGTKIHTMEEPEYRSFIKAKISNIADQSLFDELIDFCGLDTLIKELSPDGKDFASKKELDDYYVEALVAKIVPLAKKTKEQDIQEKAEQAEKEEKIKKHTTKNKILFASIVALMIIVPVIIANILGHNWTNKVEEEVMRVAKIDMAEELKKENSHYKKIGGNEKCELWSIEYLYDKTFETITIVPTLKLYYDGELEKSDKIFLVDDIGNRVLDYEFEVPSYIKSGVEPDSVYIIPNCIYEKSDGSTSVVVDGHDSYSKYESQFNPNNPSWLKTLIIIVLIGSGIAFIVLKKKRFITKKEFEQK